VSSHRVGRRRIALLLVAVLVLGGLFAADRIVHARAEQEVSRILQRELNLSDEPTVAIHGFPFLTQVVANRFGQVDLAGTGITAGTAERPLHVERMNLSLREVVTADGYRRITAGELDGTAYVAWAEISRQLGAEVTPQEGGRVRVDLSVDLYGQRADFVFSAQPVLDVPTQEVRLVEPRVLIARYRVPAGIVERIAAEYAPPVPIVLPLSLQANSLTIGADHLELGLTGSDVEVLG
jgi:hypothetical protein